MGIEVDEGGESAEEEEVQTVTKTVEPSFCTPRAAPTSRCTGDVLSIGRGRDNDIQIKNDSKVSRFHCRLFRRGGKFYIEDNKSSNGTS